MINLYNKGASSLAINTSLSWSQQGSLLPWSLPLHHCLLPWWTTKIYIITRTTHNTRISERMVTYGVKIWEPILMNETEEREITKYLQEVIEEKKIEILAYNICKDHIHLILKCEEKKRNYIVQRLKSTSARKYNINHGFTISQKNKGASSLDRGISQNHFRWQKYHRNEIKNEEYLKNAIHYVKTNRQHHNLPERS